jgi:hypothetical protein
MLGEGLWPDDPRHLGQRAALDVGLEDVEQPPARLDVGAGQRLLEQRAAGRRVLVLVEVQERVVAEVADERVGCESPEIGGVQPVADVLVDLPADPGLLQALRVGAPVVAELVVGDHRPAALAVVAVPAGPHVVAVGVGGAEHRAVVGVTHGEGVSQRVVEGQIVAPHVRHARRGLGRQPLIPITAVEHLVGAVPGVVQVLDEGERQVANVRPEGRDHGGAVGLEPDGLAAGEDHRMGVAEAAHPAHHPEVVIERAVLLHEHHDVLDVPERASPVVRRNGESPRDAVGQQRGGDAAARELEEPAPTDVRHPHHQPDIHGRRPCAALVRDTSGRTGPVHTAPSYARPAPASTCLQLAHTRLTPPSSAGVH